MARLYDGLHILLRRVQNGRCIVISQIFVYRKTYDIADISVSHASLIMLWLLKIFENGKYQLNLRFPNNLLRDVLRKVPCSLLLHN